MSNLVMIYTTWPDVDKARAAARALIGQRLAACVNILPAMTSLYRWEGGIEQADEVVMLIKTSRTSIKAIEEAVMRLHPYDTPAFMALAVSQSSHAYADWLLNALHGGG
jgi:periplasmic divalent cation tolerance protein